jgi:Zn-dependent M16 (insulinase) family peptidase
MINDAYIQLQGHLASSGYFQQVFIGEPTSITNDVGFSAAIWTTGMRIPITTLTSALRVYDTQVRIYTRAFQRDTKQVELALADTVFQVTSDLLGEYDLGGYVREIDAGGVYGAPMSVNWGNGNLNGVIYRIADITMGLVIGSVNETTMAR